MKTNFSSFQKGLALSVHIFTASGILAVFMSILAINERDWREAMFWLIVCLFIDGVDGTFARLFKVKEVLPKIDGKSIDYIIDFTSYALVPAYFFYEAGLVDDPWRLPVTFLMLLVSAMYYGMDGMVSDDKYFIGFPVLWNMVVFYLFFICYFPSWLNIVVVVAISILHFIPIKYIYPSRATWLQKIILFLSAIVFVLAGWIVYIYPEVNWWLNGLLIAITIFVVGVGLIASFRQSKSAV